LREEPQEKGSEATSFFAPPNCLRADNHGQVNLGGADLSTQEPRGEHSASQNHAFDFATPICMLRQLSSPESLPPKAGIDETQTALVSGRQQPDQDAESQWRNIRIAPQPSAKSVCPCAAASDGAAKTLAKARSGTRREELWTEQWIEDDVEFPASWSDRHSESSRQSRCYIDQPNRGLETRGGSARTTSKCQANQSRLNLRPNNPKFLLHGATLRPRSQRKNW